ncbi:MAG: STAS domain-containing protein [Oscillochloris sp.]|nr:STAS domain-containing protein [Oscillochloris sp.]
MIEVVILVVSVVLAPLSFLSPMPLLVQVCIMGLVGSTAIAVVVALALLRVGHPQRSVVLLSISLAFLCSVMLYASTLGQGALPLFALGLPITMAGLTAKRQGLLLVLAVSIVSVSVAVLLEYVGGFGAGFAISEKPNIVGFLISFAMIAALIGLFVDRVGTSMRDAVTSLRARERELETLSRHLEATVRERTADLELALGNLEVRAAEQERLLEENSRQHAEIRELSVPVLPVSTTTLVMPLVGSLDGDRLLALQDRALEAIERSSARRLLLDITGVPLVDSYVAKGIISTLQAARLLGTEVALVGVRPEVAQSIVGLGIDLSGMRTYADLQSALH